MDSSVKVIDPTSWPGWDDSVRHCKEASFFLSSCWTSVLRDAYGYTPRYLARLRNGRILAALPAMEVRSHITGKRGISFLSRISAPR